MGTNRKVYNYQILIIINKHQGDRQLTPWFFNIDSRTKKVVIYIDWSNFYFSIKKTFNCKIDIEKFCKKLAENYDLIKINYYIAPVGEANPEMYIEL